MISVQKLSAVALLTCFLGMVTACGNDDNGVTCTQEILPSVVITVVDTTGAPVQGATVTYSVDGGAFQQAVDCTPALLPSCSGNVFTAGREMAGAFVIRVERIGWQPATVEAHVRRDACHVFTAQVVSALVST